MFNKDFNNAHDAMADIMATYECYKEMLKMDYKDVIRQLDEKEKNEERKRRLNVCRKVRSSVEKIMQGSFKKDSLRYKLVEGLKNGGFKVEHHIWNFGMQTSTEIHTKLDDGFMRSLLYNLLNRDEDCPHISYVK